VLATTRHGRDVKWLAERKYPDFPILTPFHHPGLAHRQKGTFFRRLTHRGYGWMFPGWWCENVLSSVAAFFLCA
jgi:hypothetical protein